MAKYQTASRTLLTGGGGSPSLRTSSISGGSIGKLDTFLINERAGNVRKTDMPVPDIQVDTQLQSLAGASAGVVSAAFDYRERVENVKAREGVLAYKARLRSGFYGSKNEDGTVTGGYKHTQLNEAIDGFEEYTGTLDAGYMEHLKQYDEGVQVKMAEAMFQEKELALNRAVTHRLEQERLQEINVRFQDKQDILVDIENEGVEPFSNGQVKRHLDRYDNLQERLAAEEYLASQSIAKIYTKSLESALDDPTDLTPAITAYTTASASFESIRAGLSESVENKLAGQVIQMREEATKAAKVAANERKDARIAEIKRQAPTEMAKSIENGNFDVLKVSIDGYRSAFDNPDTASDRVGEALQGSLDKIAFETGGTWTDKYTRVEQAMEGIKESEASGSLSAMELHDLEVYAGMTLPKKLRNEQDYADKVKGLNTLAGMISEAEQEGRVVPYEAPPAGMLPENKERWYKAHDAHVKNMTEGIDGKTIEKRNNEILLAKMRMRHRPLTNAELNDLADNMLVAGQSMEYSKLVEKNEAMKKPTYKVPPYRRTPEYKWAEGMIDNTQGALFGFDEKPDKDEEGYALYHAERDLWMARATESLDIAAAKADKAEVPLDYKQWWADYTKDMVNNGFSWGGFFKDAGGALKSRLIDPLTAPFTDPHVREVTRGVISGAGYELDKAIEYYDLVGRGKTKMEADAEKAEMRRLQRTLGER
jgi:hypothetical protein